MLTLARLNGTDVLPWPGGILGPMPPLPLLPLLQLGMLLALFQVMWRGPLALVLLPPLLLLLLLLCPP